MTELARVTDPAALESGVAGRFALDVLPEWLDAREIISFVVPKRITCARCEGGGCDACGRSGAFRIEGDDAARTLQLTLPASPAVVRIPAPFEAPDILLVELRPAAAPTPQSQIVPRASHAWWWLVGIVIAIAVAALLYSSCHAPSA